MAIRGKWQPVIKDNFKVEKFVTIFEEVKYFWKNSGSVEIV